MILWATVAMAQEVSLGVGRAAVIQPGVAPLSVSVTDATKVDLVANPKAVVVLARKAGTTLMTVEHAGGVLEWTLVISPDPTVPPTGGPGLLAPSAPLVLPVGEGAWCRFPGASAMSWVDGKLQVHAFGVERYYLQADAPVVGDVVFESKSGLPRVLTLVGEIGATGVAPTGCNLPAPEPIVVPLHSSLDVVVGRKIGTMMVGRPDTVYALPVAETDHLTVKGLRIGSTTIAVRASDSEDPWLRRVVVAPPE